jgi:hypothetical protein
MMNKQMLEVSVKTTEEGMVEIIQEDPGMQDSSYVKLAPDQLDTVISWLKEAKAELVGERSLGDEAVDFLSDLPPTFLSPDHPDYTRWQDLRTRIG